MTAENRSLVPRRPYCLRCYAPLESIEPPCTRCAACGFPNLEIDRRIFWTKERKLCELESLVKSLIVVVVTGFSLLIWIGFATKASLGTGAGWVAGFPILVGAILWETASKITRWVPYFKATLVWSVATLTLGLLPLTLVLLVQAPASAVAWGAAIAGLFGAFALGMVGFGRWCERWRERRILSGAA